METPNNKNNSVSTPDNLNHNIPTDKISFNNNHLIKPISINTSDDLLNNPLILKNTITPDESNQVSPTQQNNPVPATDDSSGKNKIPPNKPFIMDIPEESNQALPTQQNRPTSTTDDSSGKNKIPPNKPFIMDIPEESNQASPTQQNRPTSTTDDSSDKTKTDLIKPVRMVIPEDYEKESSLIKDKTTQETTPKENTTDKHIANNAPFKTENQDKASSDSTNAKKPSQGETLKSDNLNSQFNFSTIYTIGNYVYKDGELLYISPSTKDETEIGNMWITIITEIINVEEIINEHNEVLKTEEHTQWFIRIECMGRDFTVITTTQELLDYSKLLMYTADRAYCEVDSKAKRYFKKYINLLICQSNHPREYRYKSTGWKKINNSWCYLVDVGIIGHIGRYYTTYKADVPYHFEYDSEKINSLETFTEFFNMRTLSSKKIENTVFLTHYSCLSVMTTLFQEVGYGINFVVALIGSTNSQKTATANIFTRLFNRNAKANADIRFDSTKAAILEKTASYGDAILMIDDILPYNDPSLAKQQNSIVTEIIRAYGDRTPKMRSEAYAKINKVSQYSAIRGCCLITGEILDIDFESTATRVIKLPFDRGDIDLDKLTYYQNHLMNLPTFIYGFITFLGSKIQTVFNIIQQEFSIIRKRSFPNNMAARFIDTIAIMSAETRIFYMYALEQGFLTQDQANCYRAQDMAYIEQIVMRNYIDTQAKSPAAMILLALKKAINKKEIPVYTPTDHTKLKIAKEIEEAVLIDDVYLFILPEQLWEIYKKDCKEMGRNLTYKNGRELVQPLKKENAIILKPEGKSSRATHKINAPTSKRFFIIDLTIFNKLCGIFEEF